MNKSYYHIKEGIRYDLSKKLQEKGAYIFWGFKVPFLPSLGTNNSTYWLEQQIRFIEMLHSLGTDDSGAVELRFVHHGHENSIIDIYVLFRLFLSSPHPVPSKQKKRLIERAQKMQQDIKYILPQDYTWQPILTQEEFFRARPFFLQAVKNELHITEIHKYSDKYAIYPFIWSTNDFVQICHSLLSTSSTVVISIGLQPTNLSSSEKSKLFHMSIPVPPINSSNETDDVAEYTLWAQKNKREISSAIAKHYFHNLNKPFLLRVQIVSDKPISQGLIRSIGSEIAGGKRTEYDPEQNNTPWPPNYQIKEISFRSGIEYSFALHNYLYLSHVPWHGISSGGGFPKRILYLVDGKEANCAFRLPIPQDKFVPGIAVRDEPFVQPIMYTPMIRENTSRASVELGQVIHKGKITNVKFTIGINDLKRHALIAGATGSGKTTTCLSILGQLYEQHHIPFLVLYPIDKPDYRVLMYDNSLAKDLLVFTLGDDTVAPFRFNPFFVPPGILIKTHISHLMRSFMAAFAMWDPLPIIYRSALRQIYTDKGWNVDKDSPSLEDSRIFPNLSDFRKAIIEKVDKLARNYGKEVKGNIRSASEIRIQGLLENIGNMLDVQEYSNAWDEILSRPTIMELGRIGSMEDTALVMGFLLTRLSAELISRHKMKKGWNQHFTLIEEAHRVMAASPGPSKNTVGDSRAMGGEEFSNILAEVRGYGEGIILAEQIPTNLVAGAIGNTYVKIMHWLEDQKSFDLFVDIFNLNERQRNYARILRPGQAIVRSATGQPVLIQVQPRKTLSEQQDISDERVKKFMARKVRIPIRGLWGPMCQFCNLQDCLYGQNIRKMDVHKELTNALFEHMKQEDWDKLLEVSGQVFNHNLDKVYCYLAYHLYKYQKKVPSGQLEKWLEKWLEKLQRFSHYCRSR